MKILIAAAVLLATSSVSAWADAPPPDNVKIHFALREGATLETFDIVVATSGPCATAEDKRNDRSIEIVACVNRDTLNIEWSTRKGTEEYHSRSSIPIAHGATTELGTGDGPHLTVTIP